MKKTIVQVFGVFDLLHQGHIYFLKQAKKMGDKLVVIISRDTVVRSRKNILPYQNEKTRLKNIKKLPFVYKAYFGNNNPKHNYGMVLKVKPDVIAVGYDQKPTLTIIKKNLNGLGLSPRLKRLDPLKPNKYKSSVIRQGLQKK